MGQHDPADLGKRSIDERSIVGEDRTASLRTCLPHPKHQLLLVVRSHGGAAVHGTTQQRLRQAITKRVVGVDGALAIGTGHAQLTLRIRFQLVELESGRRI